ncbi:MAG: SDR family oxidoreductase, partial [Trebonia sp.]
HEAVVAARSTGVDLVTGNGLGAALAGADAVIDTTNVLTSRARPSREFFEATARTLMRTAQQAGVAHIAALSIIGVDRVPFGYYQGKLRQEEVLRESRVPVSILRAAQFHEFPAQYLARVRGPLVPVPVWRTQPVAASEVGAALARLAVGPPVPMSELAGPREELMADLVRQVVLARGERRRVLSVRLPGATGRAMAAGGGLPSGQGTRGTQTFAEWLADLPTPP